MSFLDASVFYSRTQTHLKLVYLLCIKKFSIRNFAIGFLYAIIIGIFVPSVNIFFRLLDEIIFPNYKKIDIKQPVFIISNPRSGTTFLHRLMCMDEERFVYNLLYHTIIPSIIFFRIIDFFGSIDKKIGKPMRKFVDFVDSKMFGAWEDIHATSFNKSEEDEGLHFVSGISPSIGLITPYLSEFKELYLPDNLKSKEVESIKKYYKASIQRWMYALGADKVFLCKTVMSTGRLEILRSIFPDVKIVFLVRNPYEAIPSFTSMFAEPWKTLYPNINENSDAYREWGKLGMEYYKYFYEEKNKFKKENLVAIPYVDLIKDPKDTVLKIYNQLQLDITPTFLNKLESETQKARKYSSKHTYSLEQYGFNKDEIYNELNFIFKDLNIGR
jgi:hypothetical protein